MDEARRLDQRINRTPAAGEEYRRTRASYCRHAVLRFLDGDRVSSSEGVRVQEPEGGPASTARPARRRKGADA